MQAFNTSPNFFGVREINGTVELVEMNNTDTYLGTFQLELQLVPGAVTVVVIEDDFYGNCATVLKQFDYIHAKPTNEQLSRIVSSNVYDYVFTMEHSDGFTSVLLNQPE